MSAPKNGSLREINGERRIYYDGYWILHYPPPAETPANHKIMIDHLTKRAFHHTEKGINTPGERLDAARKAYESQSDPAKKRVNGAMLAGALFNRATTIFTAVVQLSEQGVEINEDNELMRQCGDCFREALELGKQVRHFSGEEGIDELWGEPLKAFTMPTKAFYEQRYVKIASTMRDIDGITDEVIRCVAMSLRFAELTQLMRRFARHARAESETMKQDNRFFVSWPDFVSSAEQILSFSPKRQPKDPAEHRLLIDQGRQLAVRGAQLIQYIASARVPMPRSKAKLIEDLHKFKEDYRSYLATVPQK